MCNWNLRNGSERVVAVAFNPENPRQLASASWDRTIKIWNLADGQCQQTLEGHS
jgi:WD40 repeat protein